MNSLYWIWHHRATFLKSGDSMKKQIQQKILQNLLGVSLLFFASNKLISFFPIPEKQGFAQEFLIAIENSIYLMPMIVFIQFCVGCSLLVNRLVPVSLLLLLPVSVNILLFHAFHDVHGIVPAVMIFSSNIFLMVFHFKNYKSLINSSHLY